MPGPKPPRPSTFVAAAENAACEGCHVEIAREWQTSMHREAAHDPIYLRALAREPLTFCRDCHEPEVDREVGVGCVTCHVPTEANETKGVLAGTSGGSGAPHAVLRDARFSTDVACARCHEFRFPKQRDDWARMQSTISEHLRSRAKERPCQSCHMPLVAGHRSHRFDALVEGSVAVTARRLDDERVSLTLTPRDVGHAFPTGDLFRRVAVTLDAVIDGRVLRSSTRWLGRHDTGNEPFGIADDDRLLDAPIDVIFHLSGVPRRATLVYRVVLERVEHPGEHDEHDAVIGGTTLVTSGHL